MEDGQKLAPRAEYDKRGLFSKAPHDSSLLKLTTGS